mmetsp:Transcript_2201/g.7263  ORF Transcript_2201/g.7263 Transcript_2201/m.7263 type:complete len:468 (+) Transcript_2201:3255-4658(+)
MASIVHELQQAGDHRVEVDVRSELLRGLHAPEIRRHDHEVVDQLEQQGEAALRQRARHCSPHVDAHENGVQVREAARSHESITPRLLLVDLCWRRVGARLDDRVHNLQRVEEAQDGPAVEQLVPVDRRARRAAHRALQRVDAGANVIVDGEHLQQLPGVANDGVVRQGQQREELLKVLLVPGQQLARVRAVSVHVVHVRRSVKLGVVLRRRQADRLQPRHDAAFVERSLVVARRRQLQRLRRRWRHEAQLVGGMVEPRGNEVAHLADQRRLAHAQLVLDGLTALDEHVDGELKRTAGRGLDVRQEGRQQLHEGRDLVGCVIRVAASSSYHLLRRSDAGHHMRDELAPNRLRHRGDDARVEAHEKLCCSDSDVRIRSAEDQSPQLIQAPQVDVGHVNVQRRRSRRARNEHLLLCRVQLQEKVLEALVALRATRGGHELVRVAQQVVEQLVDHVVREGTRRGDSAHGAA